MTAAKTLIDLTMLQSMPESMIIPAWIDKDTLEVFLNDSDDEDDNSSYMSDDSDDDSEDSEDSEDDDDTDGSSASE